jgi:DNA-binding transcriptional LysR family regulator
MKIFVKVAEVGSFAEAARALYLSPPAVTRAVASLESSIGSRLFVRTTRAVKITPAGSTYLDDCRRILAAVEASDFAARHAHTVPSGVLTVTAPAMFGQLYVLPVLLNYLLEQPNVSGRTMLTNRVTNLVDEDIDVAIRIGRLPDSTYRAIQVGSVRTLVCATPAYFLENGTPHQPSDLIGHRIVAATSTWAPQEWEFGNPAMNLKLNPRLMCDSDESTIAATVAGWGITRLLAYKVVHLLNDGTLQTVLADYEQSPIPVHVVHTEGRHASAKVRLFVDKLVAELRQNPLLN